MSNLRGSGDDHQNLGEVLREARQRQGLSIRQVAAKAGIHYSYLARLESAEKVRPNTDVLQNLADVLEIDVSELLLPRGVRPTLPEPRMYFRRKLGVSAQEADVLASLIEEYRAKQKPTQDNQIKGGGNHEESN